ncbi:MAG: cell division protein FtsZ, partial [Clostridia bacterium]|nr:cell division protein FtsZ [Clostridia bacterium]
APRRSSNAAQGIEEMRKYVDSLVIIPNEKLYEILKKDVSFVDAFRYADDVLRQAIQGVSELISVPGLINLDFADVSTIMKDKGIVHMGIGRGEGPRKTIDAVREAVTSKLLETSIEGATGIIINIVGGKDLTLSEVYEAVDLVRQVADPNCNVIFGARIRNDLTGVTETSVIATGFNEKEQPAEAAPEFKDNSADIRTFTEPVKVVEEPKKEEPKEEVKPVVAEEKVEDISIQPKKPFIDDEDLPPFLRKLHK